MEQRIEEIRERYGTGDVVTRCIEKATPELVAVVDRVEARLSSGSLAEVGSGLAAEVVVNAPPHGRVHVIFPQRVSFGPDHL